MGLMAVLNFFRFFKYLPYISSTREAEASNSRYFKNLVKLQLGSVIAERDKYMYAKNLITTIYTTIYIYTRTNPCMSMHVFVYRDL